MAERRPELAFLPAVDEIAERAPRLQARIMLWTILLCCVLALAWATWGEVDVTAVAHGRIVPSARVKRVQPVVGGSIVAIHVHEGQVVDAGEPVVELEATQARAEHLRLAVEAARLASERARLEALLAAVAEPRAGMPQSAELPPALRRRVEREYAAHVGERVALVHELARLRAEAAADSAEIARADATLPLLGERVAAIGALQARALAPRLGWLELEEQRVDRSYERDVLDARRAAREALIAGTQARLSAFGARAESDWQSALAEINGALAETRQRLSASAAILAAHHLRAPIDGVVQQLAVHTIGGVVAAGDELMLVVPRTGGLEVEAWIANKDIGFVHVSQPATVKIETFPFTTYGTIDGELAALAADAVNDDARGLVYRARVTLETTLISRGGRAMALGSGMAVSVEFALGRRRIIEFLAAPLLRYRDEALRER